jgi:hypothetical protein
MPRGFLRFLRSNTLALLALFIALGGTTYAATALPKNSVGTKQLKKNAVTAVKIKNGNVTNGKIGKNAVTGAKVKDNSLTGADVLESSLATVPSATNATHATASDTATTATNATTVGGLAPSSLTRVATANLNGDHFVGTATTTDMTSVTLNVPVRSNVLVTATGGLIASSPAACPCVLQEHLRTTGETAATGTAPTFIQNINIGEAAASFIGGFDRLPFSVSRVFKANPGSNTYFFTLVKQTTNASPTTTTLGTAHITLTAQTSPFNGDGTTAAPDRKPIQAVGASAR